MIAGQLFNPNVSVHQLSDTIQGRALPPSNTNERLHLYLDGLCIVARRGDREVEVGELIESFGDPLVEEAHKHLMAVCRIMGED